MTRREANNYFPHLMASATAIDCNTAASTNLTFSEGATLATHTPTYAVVVYNSGTPSALVFSIKCDAIDLSSPITASTAAFDSSKPKIPLNLMRQLKAITNDPAKFLEFDVTTPAGAACTVDVYVYGIEQLP